MNNSLVILMMETEQPESLSARKLVVEAAKHNVITAYNAQQGMALLRRFPNVDIVLIHGGLLADNPTLISQAREIFPSKPIILATPDGGGTTPGVDYTISSYEPHALIGLLLRIFPGT